MELPVWTPFSGVRKKSYILETRNLSFKLCGWFGRYFGSTCFRKAETAAAQKVILHNVNCEARPGDITAIAGPSGAGKTTLLEVLAGKISQSEVTGHVLVNGRPVDSRCFQGLSGYVTQDDALFPLLTVEETLLYSALLRLPGGRNQAASRVKEVLRVLGLNHIAGSRIGEGANHGISGGERRRVSIGVELVHDPAVILIDEPTSGLDSGSALLVVALLKSMAVNLGKTIVLTVHQPGFRILQLLDRLVLLSNGYVVHNGPLNLLEQNLISTGHRIPRSVNVLEYAIDVIECLPEHTPATSQSLCLLEKNNSETKETKDHSLRNGYSSISEENNLHHPNSLFEEVAILGQRFCSNIFRTKELFTTRILQALIAGIVLGTIFFNAGKEKSKLSLQTQTGFFAFSLTFLLSSITEGLPIYLQERRILERETARGAYRISSYVLANTFIFIPFLLIVSLVYSTPVYWLVGLKKDIEGYLYFSLVVWMVLLMSNSFVACFSALVPNFIMGTSVIAGLMGSFFLFSGYFISKENIPNYWIFMHHLSLFKYPFECFMINEYGDQGNNRCIEIKNGQCSLYGSTFLRQQDLIVSQKWTNLALILGFIIGYRVLSFFVLWYRCCRTRN